MGGRADGIREDYALHGESSVSAGGEKGRMKFSLRLCGVQPEILIDVFDQDYSSGGGGNGLLH